LIFIDTDALYNILAKNSKKGEEIFQKLEQSGESFAITSITLYEILYLFMRRGKDASQIHLLRVFEFSKEDAQKAAELEIELEKKGKRVLTTSLITAAIVMNKGGSLCALNKDFNELKNVGLKLYL
jgi:predicted nucleic acid-binding protein